MARRRPHVVATAAAAAGAGLAGREAAFLVSGQGLGAAQAPRLAARPATAAPEAPAAGSASAALVAAGAAAGSTIAGSRQAAARRLSASVGFAGFASAAATAHRASSTSAAATIPKQRVTDLLEEHDIIMFSKTTCPFCSRAKAVLKEQGAPFFVFELDELPPEETAAMQDALAEMTGARTVPRIFARGNCLGGCDDVVALQQSGELAKVISGDSFQIQRSEAEWQELLGSQRYQVLRRQGTEPPGSHEYDNFMPTQGHFACGACGLPLYSASSKFRSSCGWPVFDKCYYSEAADGCHVGTVPEFGGLEIVCNRCSSHLGHVFFDAYSPQNPNGERH